MRPFALKAAIKRRLIFHISLLVDVLLYWIIDISFFSLVFGLRFCWVLDMVVVFSPKSSLLAHYVHKIYTFIVTWSSQSFFFLPIKYSIKNFLWCCLSCHEWSYFVFVLKYICFSSTLKDSFVGDRVLGHSGFLSELGMFLSTPSALWLLIKALG